MRTSLGLGLSRFFSLQKLSKKTETGFHVFVVVIEGNVVGDVLKVSGFDLSITLLSNHLLLVIQGTINLIYS